MSMRAVQAGLVLSLGALVGAADGAIAASSQFLGVHWWRLEPQPYFDPLRAEVRSANVRVAFPAMSDAFPFSQSTGRRPVWDITMGREIPVLGFATGEATGEVLAPGDWGAGIWLPIGFHMIEDLKDPSGPILNVDYRFGAMIKIDRATAGGTQLGLRWLGAHESTHVGDEFVIAARRLYPDFERINVSHEFWDVAIGLNRPFEPKQDDELRGTSHLRVIAGLQWLWNPDDGWYSSDTTETNGRVVPTSKRSAEPYAGVEYSSGTRFAFLFMNQWAPFVSAEIRNRIVYDYHRADSDEREETQWSVNALLGIWNTERGPKTAGGLEFYLRYYYGANPHGQFRSQRDYTLYGLGLQMGY